MWFSVETAAAAKETEESLESRGHPHKLADGTEVDYTRECLSGPMCIDTIVIPLGPRVRYAEAEARLGRGRRV